ncbi:MAG: Trigger factor [Chlamydiae bacterium]|nr:Trigger factor [Chlamydiota bacterium]
MTKEDSTEATPKEEFKNDLVHFHVTRKPRCVVEYEVDVQKVLVLEARKKATRVVGKNVVVPGFRKGKAPPEIVAKRYPQDLDRKWQEEIANGAYRECAQLAMVPLVRNDATISFKMHKHSTDGAKLTLSFETIPEIPSVDPSKCKLEKIKRPETSPTKVDETIRQTQLFFAKWKPILDRPVKEGDFVIMNVDIIEQDPPQSLFTNTRFEVADKSMAQWMKKLVLGQKQGAVIEGTSVADDGLSEDEKKNFQPKKVRVTINVIEEAEVPALDDQFAKQLGVDSIDQLSERIGALLNKQADDHVRDQEREQVTEYLLSIPFDLPQFVIEKEAQFRLQQMMQDLNFKKQWDGSTDAIRKGHIDSVMHQAERAVRIFYICRKISADQNISVTAKDLPLPSNDPLEALLNPGAQMHDPRQPDVKQAEAFSRVLLERTEDWVIEHAGVKEKALPEKKQDKPTVAEPKAKKAPAKKAAVAEPKAKKAPAKKSPAKKAAGPKPAPKKAAKKTAQKTAKKTAAPKKTAKKTTKKAKE